MNRIYNKKPGTYRRVRIWLCSGVIVALSACTLTIEKPDEDDYAHHPGRPDAPVISRTPAPEPRLLEQRHPPEFPELKTPDLRIAPVTEISKLSREQAAEQRLIQDADLICERVGAKLASIEYTDCSDLGLTAEMRSVNGAALVYKIYPPLPERAPLGRVLLLGGTHGDELTSVSIVFKWMATLDQHHSGLFEWLVAPLVNPDGVLDGRATRTNTRGIDLNRNLPTPNWDVNSRIYWEGVDKAPKYFPGKEANSEPESKWLVSVIEQFNPDVIISVHAPLHLLDFDALDRSISPLNLGILKKDLQGVFPGSLGNYAGIQRGVPVITLELPHSWSMPSKHIVDGMWVDTVQWLKQNMLEARAQRSLMKAEKLAKSLE